MADGARAPFATALALAGRPLDEEMPGSLLRGTDSAQELENEDQDADDLLPGVDEDALESDDLDTDRITSDEFSAAALARSNGRASVAHSAGWV